MKTIYDAVVRYTVAEADGDTGELKIHMACHTKKEAKKFRKELMGEKSKRNIGIDEFIFDESKIGFNRSVRDNFTPAFSVKQLDYPFEVGMAVDWVNHNTVDVEIKPDKISDWM